MATYSEIVTANAGIVTTNIRGKEYADVAQRVIAFRKVYPQGTIRTEMVTNEGDTGRRLCVFRAVVGVHRELRDQRSRKGARLCRVWYRRWYRISGGSGARTGPAERTGSHQTNGSTGGGKTARTGTGTRHAGRCKAPGEAADAKRDQPYGDVKFLPRPGRDRADAGAVQRSNREDAGLG